MSTEQKSLGQIAWEIETDGYGWQWREETAEYRAHWERIANAVAAAVFERQKSASQEDAEHAAMYRWLRDEWDGLPLAGGRKGFDAAIRAAMSAGSRRTPGD